MKMMLFALLGRLAQRYPSVGGDGHGIVNVTRAVEDQGKPRRAATVRPMINKIRDADSVISCTGMQYLSPSPANCVH